MSSDLDDLDLDPDLDDRRGYGQYCPIGRAVEVLGERWSLLIVRDMLCGYDRFNDLARGLPGLSRTLLSKRLRQLVRAGVVAKDGERYVLTAAGQDLRPIVFGLGEWGAKYQFGAPHESEMDPQLLMWWVHRRLDFSALPDRRVVIEFRFRDHRERFWIVRDSQGPSVCMADPGFGIDAVVTSDLPVLYQVWLGRIALRTALRDGRVEITGTPAIARKLPAAMELSPVAGMVAAAR